MHTVLDSTQRLGLYGSIMNYVWRHVKPVAWISFEPGKPPKLPKLAG